MCSVDVDYSEDELTPQEMQNREERRRHNDIVRQVCVCVCVWQ